MSDATAIPAGRTAAARAIQPAMVVGVLLLACLMKGLAATWGVAVPPDPDTVRDLGSIQGFIDGQWMNDPMIGDARRWYPPALHALAALFIGGLGLPLLPVWLKAGAFLNLLSPLSFYLMNRRLIGAWPAAAATSVLVLFDSAVMPGDATAGYTPWTLTPALSWPLFFGSIWLIADRLPRFRLINAVWIGAALGLVFVAHTVPAILLSAITAVTGITVGGLRPRTFVWLAVTALTQLALATPFLWPLITTYHLHIANPFPGAWVHPALTDPMTLLPNLLGIAALIWLIAQRASTTLPLISIAILAAWIITSAAFLARHLVCAAAGEIGEAAAGETGAACGIFVVAPHHYHVYLQAAWATVLGLALVQVHQSLRPLNFTPWLILAALTGFAGLYTKPEDRALRHHGSTKPERILDRAAYDWILRETDPHDLFVTELPPDGVDMGPAAATVIAAGRRLVAPPRVHANPYLEWEPLNQRRLAWLAPGAALCPFWLQAQSAGGAALFLLPNDRPARMMPPVFQDAFNTIYRLGPTVCASGKRVEDLLQRRQLVSRGG